jgi:hypothetical protein
VVDKATKHIYAKRGKNKAANRPYVKKGHKEPEKGRMPKRGVEKAAN